MNVGEPKRYKIVISGGLRKGHELYHAKCAFADLFQLSMEQAQVFFDGNSRVLQMDLSETRARVYAKALRNIGMQPKLIQQAQSIVCPMCYEKQPLARECCSCGLLIDTYLEGQAQQARNLSGGSALIHPSAVHKAADFGNIVAFGTAALAMVASAWIWY